MKNFFGVVVLWAITAVCAAQVALTPEQIQAARESAMSITKTNQGPGTTERQTTVSDMFGSSPSAVVQGEDLTVLAASYLSLSGKLTCPTNGTKISTVSAMTIEVVECLYSGSDLIAMRLRACRDLMNGGRCQDVNHVIIADKFTATTQVNEGVPVTFWPGDETTPDGLTITLSECNVKSCKLTGRAGWGGTFHPNTVTDQANSLIAQQGDNSMVADINRTANSGDYSTAQNSAVTQGQCFYNQTLEMKNAGSLTACDGSNTTQVYDNANHTCAQEQVCSHTEIQHQVYDSTCNVEIRTYPVECQTHIPSGECDVTLERAPYDCHDIRELTPEVCHVSYATTEKTCHRHVDVSITRDCTPGELVLVSNVKYDYAVDGPFYPVVVHCDNAGTGFQITIPDNITYWQNAANAQRNGRTIGQELAATGATMATVASWGAYGSPVNVTANNLGTVVSSQIATVNWSVDNDDQYQEEISFELSCNGGATCDLSIDLKGKANCTSATCVSAGYPWDGVTQVDASDTTYFPLYVGASVTDLEGWPVVTGFSARAFFNIDSPFHVANIEQTEVDECP